MIGKSESDSLSKSAPVNSSYNDLDGFEKLQNKKNLNTEKMKTVGKYIFVLAIE